MFGGNGGSQILVNSPCVRISFCIHWPTYLFTVDSDFWHLEHFTLRRVPVTKRARAVTNPIPDTVRILSVHWPRYLNTALIHLEHAPSIYTIYLIIILIMKKTFRATTNNNKLWHFTSVVQYKYIMYLVIKFRLYSNELWTNDSMPF